MKPKILADEYVDFRIVKNLRKAGFDVMSILEDHPSVADKHILEIARDTNAVLLTEDSDFGKWIFAHKVKRVGVIFLRYKSCYVSKIATSLLSVLNTHQDRLLKKFVVITVGKIRIREL